MNEAPGLYACAVKRWLVCGVLMGACDASATAPSTSKEAAPEDGRPNAAAPSPQPEGEDWIVWFDRGQGVRSRWYSATADAATLVAEREALAVSDGSRLWHVQRADASKTVMDCACMEEASERCTQVGAIATPGLRAMPMDEGPPVVLEAADTQTTYGDVDALSLWLRGGVGPRLFVETADAGYFCGAHGSSSSHTAVRDASSPAQPGAWPSVALPQVLLRQAALSNGMFDDVRACGAEGEVSLDDFTREQMRIVSVSMSLDAGMVELRWHAEADGPHVCTGEEAFHGYVDSGLMPPAEPLGLGGPMPAGLARAMIDVGTASVVGWSKVERAGAQRDAALQWFGTLDETPWPPATVAQTAAPNAP